MGMSAALILNIALDLLAFGSIAALASWAIRTGEREPPGQRRFHPGRGLAAGRATPA
jgi:hypothetical protein